MFDARPGSRFQVRKIGRHRHLISSQRGFFHLPGDSGRHSAIGENPEVSCERSARRRNFAIFSSSCFGKRCIGEERVVSRSWPLLIRPQFLLKSKAFTCAATKAIISGFSGIETRTALHLWRAKATTISSAARTCQGGKSNLERIMKPGLFEDTESISRGCPTEYEHQDHGERKRNLCRNRIKKVLPNDCHRVDTTTMNSSYHRFPVLKVFLKGGSSGYRSVITNTRGYRSPSDQRQPLSRTQE